MYLVTAASWSWQASKHAGRSWREIEQGTWHAEGEEEACDTCSRLAPVDIVSDKSIV